MYSRGKLMLEMSLNRKTVGKCEESQEVNVSLSSPVNDLLQNDETSGIERNNNDIDGIETAGSSTSMEKQASTTVEALERPIPGKSKKKKAQPSNWKRNVNKNKRNLGQEYITTKDKIVKSRSIRICPCKCIYKCNTKFNEAERKVIFKQYWMEGDLKRQRDYIGSYTTRQQKRRSLGESDRRKFTIGYYLPTTGGDKVQVCRNFFISTLGETERKIKTSIEKSRSGISSPDKRGRHIPPHAISASRKAYVHAHIQSFHCVPSHYTRKDTKRQYLDPTLTTKEMYRLYLAKCKVEHKQSVSLSAYSNIFRTKYNLGFLHPKKDRCEECDRYESMPDSAEKEVLRNSYNEHRQCKDIARTEMQNNSMDATLLDNCVCLSSDLQQVLQAPYSNLKGLYYKRKLNVYNFTIYDNGKKEAKCYVWHEGTAGRGSCEMASCMLKHLLDLPDTVSHVIGFSDGCGGQNKNRFMCAAFLHAVNTIPHLQIIDQKFLVKGHSEMPCDSVHAAIETAKTGRRVYGPSDWYQIIQNAKRDGHPYSVYPMQQTFFYDFKHLSEMFNLQIGAVANNGEKIKWSQVVWYRFEKEFPKQIKFKYSYKEDFITLQLKSLSKRKSSALPLSLEEQLLKKLYNSKLPISEAKKKDLLDMCKTNDIIEEYHAFYKSLVVSTDIIDESPVFRGTTTEEQTQNPDDSNTEENPVGRKIGQNSVAVRRKITIRKK